MSYRVKSNKELFDKFSLLGLSIANLKSIVQNDMIIPKKELIEWTDSAMKFDAELRNLIYKVRNHIAQNEIDDE